MILKQTVGIDVAEEYFEARFGSIDNLQNENISQAVKFDNNTVGFRKFYKWAMRNQISDKENTTDNLPLFFVMEVTGVYHENLAYFLYEQGQKVAVILPNKIRNYGKSLETKSKTDPIDAATITRFGLERKLPLWTPPEPFVRAIKALSREYHSINAMITEVKNKVHAKKSAHYSSKETMNRNRKLLKVLDKQLQETLQELMNTITSNSVLAEKVKKINTIKGVGEITIVTILAETGCFENVENINQLVSYAGLDVVFNESGKKKGKTTISKKGNKFIRSALFMPAMSACRYNNKLKEVYLRLIARGKNKKAALIAVARKLLALIYTLWKKDVEFIQDYNSCLGA